ncbi:hypothetical protein C882_2355 [Caenispirillum salinarum AK4]|uniref:Fe/B12 periplasmic-binding domain-containing protein n=1 Tax=Caenispirillum salinarum AK4 TaxID=1238182 RepID=K9HPS6_9PROT|nr:iron-siderophore ABC transporter substrate-binding protein [Caenispirillum salinarum]EKV32278.1 hypothetical protein C882_2355 [Caenispirillum salinarum AK4]
MRLLTVCLLLLGLAAPAAAAPLTVEDSGGTHTFQAPPERVVALSWSLTEQLLNLDVTPVGVADPEGYRHWVVRPALPEGVADLGLRQEPNLERIAELAPDAILISDDQRAFLEPLARIAPVLHFETFSADHDNLAASRETYQRLATLLDREGLAAERLAERDARLQELRERVRAHFDGDPPKVTVVRFLDEARLAVYGGNAMSTFALEALGLESGLPQPDSKWGFAMLTLRDLARLTEGVLLYIEPVPKGAEQFDKPLWKALPVVRAGNVEALPPTWSYGGVFSVVYFAEAITDALLRLDPQ